MKVIDSFTFFNEFNHLKLRLFYLNEVVDFFLISECNYTHSGKPKPYYLDDVILDLPEDINQKIIRLKYEPNVSEFEFNKDEVNYYDLENDHWKLERKQRNFITQNLFQFSSNDFFMLSDVDEIPNLEIVKECKEVFKSNNNTLPKNFSASVLCKLYYYNFNTMCGDNWHGTVFTKVQNAIETTCDYLRFNRFWFYPIKNGGWHFSTFGNVSQIKTKIQSFAHQEYNNEFYTSDENILNSIQNKKDIYHNSGSFANYNFENFPDDLKKNIIKIYPRELYTI